jgi:hypothetical protein
MHGRDVGEPGRDPTEHAGFARVRVHKIRLLASKQSNELHHGHHVAPRRGAAHE